MSNNSIRITITGKVQGVGYRSWVVRLAEKMGVCGWVRNVNLDKLEIMAVGKPALLDTFTAQCRVGPPLAVVKTFEIQAVKSQETLTDFRIIDSLP